MNKKLVLLTTLSIYVFLFDESSAKLPLRAERGEEHETTINEIEEEKHSSAPTTFSDDYYGENIHVQETPYQNKPDNKDITKNSNGENKINETVDFDGTNCILKLADGKTKIIGEFETSIEVREKKNNDRKLSILPEDILEISFYCSSPNYDIFTYCARLKFFGSKGINIVKNSTLFERNNPKNISEYKKNYMQDMALVMIGGCVICGSSSNQTITIKFIQLHKKGPLENVCPETHEDISILELDLTKYNNNFIVGGILSERLCPRKSLNEEIELAPLTYKHKFKIEIEHSCEGEPAKHVINFEKELDLKDLEDHVFEMKGLSIHLTGNSTEETYDWKLWNEIFVPKKVDELKTSTELVPTIETINKTTEASNTTKEKETEHSTQPAIPDGPDFVELDGEQPGEEEKEENDPNKKDEIKQGEENVLQGIYLEETTHSVDEGKEEQKNEKQDMSKDEFMNS